MRRLDPTVREELLRCRAEVTRASEIFEMMAARGIDSEKSQQKFDQYISSITAYAATLIADEVARVANEFDFDPFDEWTAFPYDKGETDFDDSASDYASELASDLLQVYDVPALAVVDELEQWLDSVWTHHQKKREIS